MVCHLCHQSLGGGLALGATGEFKVPSAAFLDAAGASMETRASTGEQPNATNVCSWCGKLEPEVKKLLGRGNAALCNECVSLASDILDAELGPTWR